MDEKQIVELISSLVIGICSGMAASWIFAHYLMMIKPKIAVASTIAKGKSEGRVAYKIKVRNLRRRKVVDIQAELFLAWIVMHPGGMAEVTKAIPLKRNTLLELGGVSKKHNVPDYVWRFITFDLEFEKFLLENASAYLRFTITGKDSFSGKSDSFTFPIRDIKEGEFIQGESFEIRPSI